MAVFFMMAALFPALITVANPVADFTAPMLARA